jgi:hypothetical protein
VLNHRDVILNRSLSQLSSQENNPDYHLKPNSIESTGVQRQETTHRVNSVQRRTIHPSHGHTQHMGSLIGRLNSIQRRTYPGECHIRCNHQQFCFIVTISIQANKMYLTNFKTFKGNITKHAFHSAAYDLIKALVSLFTHIFATISYVQVLTFIHYICDCLISLWFITCR